MELYCMHCLHPISDGASICPACNRPVREEVPAHHLLPGTVLNKKFYIGHALGEGGFGITYIGRDLMLDMIVAIKEYYPNGCVYRSNTVSPQVNSSSTEDRKVQFQKGRERFLREARVLAKFSGEPGIVDVRDFFEEYNTAYIVMEFLDGETLKSYLRREGKLAPEKAVSLLMPVMQTLKEVHAHGLIHRDISPDNIMLVRNKIKLLDFGAARDVTDANKSLSVMLKPGYAPEEQYRSKGQQGPWTDVYALCATIYKCITGITPDDSMQRVYQDELRPVSSLGIAISPSLDAALMKGMAIMQNNRYQNIDELLYGIENESPRSAFDSGLRTGDRSSDEDGATVIIMNDDIRNRPVATPPAAPEATATVCHRCGKELKPGVKFCTGCGARQDASAVTPKPIPMPDPKPDKKAEKKAAKKAKADEKKVEAADGNVCKNCGKELKPGVKFCTGCGSKIEVPVVASTPAYVPPVLPVTPPATPVPPAPAIDAPASNTCKNCGKVLKSGVKFCTGCGHKTDAEPTAVPIATPATPAYVPPVYTPPTPPVYTPPAPPAANICTRCGNQLKPNQRFCTGCGTAVGGGNTGAWGFAPPAAFATPAPYTPPANVCKQCGKPHKPGQRFCTGCGATIV